jgi:hypothetical protein
MINSIVNKEYDVCDTRFQSSKTTKLMEIPTMPSIKHQMKGEDGEQLTQCTYNEQVLLKERLDLYFNVDTPPVIKRTDIWDITKIKTLPLSSGVYLITTYIHGTRFDSFTLLFNTCEDSPTVEPAPYPYSMISTCPVNKDCICFVGYATDSSSSNPSLVLYNWREQRAIASMKTKTRYFTLTSIDSRFILGFYTTTDYLFEEIFMLDIFKVDVEHGFEKIHCITSENELHSTPNGAIMIVKGDHIYKYDLVTQEQQLLCSFDTEGKIVISHMLASDVVASIIEHKVGSDKYDHSIAIYAYGRKHSRPIKFGGQDYYKVKDNERFTFKARLITNDALFYFAHNRCRDITYCGIIDLNTFIEKTLDIHMTEFEIIDHRTLMCIVNDDMFLSTMWLNVTKKKLVSLGYVMMQKRDQFCDIVVINK